MKRIRSRKGAPGIVDVAARANVSPATVSRFFNNPEMLREPTRLKIQQAAEELNYIRDRMAGSMHNRFSGTIGLVVPTIDNAIFAELTQAFAARLYEEERTILIAEHGYDLKQEVAIIRSLLERRIDGIALVGIDHNDVSLNMLAQRDVPVISIWNYEEGGQLPCIGADNFEAGKMAANHLLELGHRDIAYLFPDTQTNDRARSRVAGMTEAMNSKGISINKQRVYNCPYDIGISKALASKILQLDKPTAFICGNDVIAQGVIYACQAAGVHIPNEISVVGIGDFRGSAHMEPELTTIRLPAKRIGQLAANAIIKMSETGMAPIPLHHKVQISLMNRGSTKAI